MNTKIEPNFDGSIEFNVDGGTVLKFFSLTAVACYAPQSHCKPFANQVSLASLAHSYRISLEPLFELRSRGSASHSQTFHSSYKNVDKIPQEEPYDKMIVAHKTNLNNIYSELISVLKQSTQEYYNMRMVLGFNI